jgi:hypothetical protein
MTELLNTHYYDNKVKDIYMKLLANDTMYPLATLKEFRIVVQEIFEFIRRFKTSSGVVEKMKQNAYRTLVLFKQDVKNNKDQNGLSVEDILPRIWRILVKDDPDAIIYFIEQLADIITMGPCNNGRINRLVQVYKCLVEK